MSRLAYVNGRYVPHGEASVHVEDRGYQFADGVYEVILVLNRQLIDCDGHIRRLYNSLKNIDISAPFSESALRMIIARMMRVNQLVNGTIYIQITRGVARRDHKFSPTLRPSVVMTAKALAGLPPADHSGVSAITAEDERWARRDIKTIQLLPNCLAKQRAAEAGAFEAILVMPDGTISEGASTNVWIVTQAGELITRQANQNILNGITRQSVQALAATHQLTVIERPFSVDEMMAAREVLLTSATSIVTSVTQIDDKEIGTGRVGNVGAALRQAYLEQASNGNL
jgi:D-alanine transaminase